MSWVNLPEDILLIVCENLMPKDVISLSSVCKPWHRVCQNNLLWKKLLLNYLRGNSYHYDTGLTYKMNECPKGIKHKLRLNPSVNFKEECIRISNAINSKTPPFMKANVLVNRNNYCPQIVKYSKNGQQLAVLDELQFLMVYRRESKEEPYRQILKRKMEHFDYESYVEFSPSGNKLLVASKVESEEKCFVTVYLIQNALMGKRPEFVQWHHPILFQDATWYSNDVIIGVYLEQQMATVWISSVDETIQARCSENPRNIPVEEECKCEEENKCIFGKDDDTLISYIKDIDTKKHSKQLKNILENGYMVRCSKDVIRIILHSGATGPVDSQWCGILIKRNDGDDNLRNSVEIHRDTSTNMSKHSSHMESSVKCLCNSQYKNIKNIMTLDDIRFELVIKNDARSIHFVTIDESVLKNMDCRSSINRRVFQTDDAIDEIHLSALNDALYFRSHGYGPDLRKEYRWKEINFKTETVVAESLLAHVLQYSHEPSHIFGVSQDYIAVQSTDKSVNAGFLIVDRCYGTIISKLKINRNTMVTQLSFNPRDQEELILSTHKRRFASQERGHQAVLGFGVLAHPFETTSYRIQHWTTRK